MEIDDSGFGEGWMREMKDDAYKSEPQEVEAVMSRLMNGRLQRLVAELLMKNQKLRGAAAMG